MSISPYELADRFADQNPEAGNFDMGVVHFEQVQALASIIGKKVTEVSRLCGRTLNEWEVKFIRGTADLSASSLQHMIKQGMPIPDSELSRVHLQDFFEVTQKKEKGRQTHPTVDEIIESPFRMIGHLDALLAGVDSLHSQPLCRRRFEKYTLANLGLITQMADYVGGINIDPYLKWNFQSMIGRYEQAVAD